MAPPVLPASVSPDGAPGTSQTRAITTTVISFDAALVPAALIAFTRTKYVPGVTPVVPNVVAIVPVFRLARFARPALDPASTTYAAGVPPVTGALQESVTLVPATAAVSAVGAPGAESAFG